MAQETVLIEFVTNDEQLKSSEDRLVSMGKAEKQAGEEFKKTNVEIKKQEASLATLDKISQQINSTGKVTKKNLSDLATAVKSMSGSFQKEFKEGVIEALKAAGVSLEEFESHLEGTEEKTVSLKSQLRQMIAALAQMKVEGKDNTEAYRTLAKQAGELKDTIADANQEVKNFGSDTSTFDGLIGVVQGVAGGFAVVQGAAALFGDESEELQKTLLRVNAAMAILQGLQQIQTVLQKESAAAIFANTIATRAQTAAQAALAFVVGGTTGALKVFRLALAATGVGLLVIGLYELVQALKDTDTSLEDANASLENQERLLESTNTLIERRTDLEIARLKASDAAESAIIAATGRSLQAQREALVFANKTLAAQRDALDATSEAWFKLNAQIEKNNETIEGIDNKTIITSINFQKQLADEEKERRKKALEDAKKAADEARQREKEARVAGFADAKAFRELQLLQTKEGSKEQLEVRKLLLRAELQQQLDNDKLTENQRKLLVKQFFADRLKLEQDFNKARDAITFANIASGIQADLAQLEVSQERKLELIITGLQVQAEVERAAAEGNSAKIAEIEARRDKAIRDARIASIQEVVDYELRLASATNGPENRRLQKIAADSNQEASIRIKSIDQIAATESEAIGKRIAALNKEKEQKLINQKDYDLQYAELIDQQTKVWEDAEQKKTDITKAEVDKRKQETIREIQEVMAVASQVVGVLESLYSAQSQAENNRINEQKQRLKDLTDAGAITEKEAITRQKRIDAEERKIKQVQAQRDKQIAVFKALLAIPEAFLQGLSQGGLILAAIYASLATVQAALVISRPVPKFGKGKNNRYEGLAEVGETGPEMIERNGHMYYVPRKTITYIGARDKVFNPMETAAMLTKGHMNTERDISVIGAGNGIEINYEEFGKSVAKYVSTTVNVDGVQAQQIKQNQFTQWLNSRRSL